MADINSVFKSEVVRLARKESKGDIAQLKKAAAAHRRDIAALKRRIAQLEKLLNRAAKQSGAAGAAKREVEPAEGENLRFRAAGFAQHRQRLGLSAAQMGKLLGASALSVYKWESGKAKPRQGSLAAIAAVRKMGKREATKRLAELG